MINWREIPFVRLFLPFALGIVAAECGFALPAFWGNIGLGIATFILVFVTVRRVAFRQRAVFGIPLSIFLILMGSQFVFYRNELNDARHFQQFLTIGFRFALQGGNSKHVQSWDNDAGGGQDGLKICR